MWTRPNVNQIYANNGKFHGVVLPPTRKKERKNPKNILSLGAKHNRPEKSREKNLDVLGQN